MAVSSNFSSNQMRLNKSYFLLCCILYFSLISLYLPSNNPNTNTLFFSNPSLQLVLSLVLNVEKCMHASEKTAQLNFHSSTCNRSKFLCLKHYCDILRIPASQNSFKRKEKKTGMKLNLWFVEMKKQNKKQLKIKASWLY